MEETEHLCLLYGFCLPNLQYGKTTQLKYAQDKKHMQFKEKQNQEIY